MNKVTLIGRLGKDPETKTLDGGNSVTSFSLATTEKYKNKAGEYQDATEWHNVTMWGKTGENFAKYHNKGDMACVSGKITTRSWEKDGVKKYTTEIVGREWEFVGGGKSESNGAAAHTGPAVSDVPNGQPADDSDLPF